MDAVLRAAEVPAVGNTYYVVNVAHQALLDTHGGPVWVWNNKGKPVLEVVATNTSRHRGNLHWTVVKCPHEDGAVYLVNNKQASFLDTNGSAVQVWNNGGKDVGTIIRENTSIHAGNLRWKLLPCDHQKGTFYIISARHSAFLDTHGTTVNVWNNGGKAVAAVIRENTSKHAGNLRWAFIDTRKQDRFGSALGIFGLKDARTDLWAKVCCAAPVPLRQELRDIIRSQRTAADRDEYAAVFRSYSLPSPLYHAANTALLEDSLEASEATSFVLALRRAIYDRCRRGGNVNAGWVWRGMTVDESVLLAYQKGQKFLWPNFVSASKEERLAFPGNVLFGIDMCGFGLTFAVDIELDSNMPWEREVVIYPYSGFEVTDRLDNYTDANGCVRTLIKLRTCDTLAIDERLGLLPMAAWEDLKAAIGL